KLVGPAENAPDVAQRHIGRIIGVGTGRTMGQDFPQLPPKSLLMQKVRPHHHAAMGGQPLIGKRNPNGRSVIFGVNWQAHRLVRLPSRFGNLIWFHHHKPAKRCSLFQAESFRLRQQTYSQLMNVRPIHSFLLPVLLAALGLILAGRSSAQTFTNLHNFAGSPRDGAHPQAGLIISGNTLYGATDSGGSASNGTVFAINANGTGFTNLYSFTATSGSYSTNSDGAYPAGTLLLSGSTLYGTAQYGGTNGNGTVFAVNTDGTGFTILHSFNGGSDGSVPHAVLISSGIL